jgi:hypothetical protein
MKIKFLRQGCAVGLIRHFTALVCATLLVPGNFPLFAGSPQQTTQQAMPQTQQATQQNVQIPSDQLDALVAPIALYPDPLLSQTLVASTYPLEIMQLQQWLQRNPGLKDQALVNAVSKQPWDPSIQAMASLPDMVKRLSDDIQWTTDLGNAFLAQQGDVMNAVQRMRAKAESKGSLVSNDRQTVQTEVVDNKSVIVIEQANPEVVYVPSYNPEAVYGPPVYPYPPIYYPPYSEGAMFAASAISFGVGVAMGAAWGGGWGWGAGWGHNDIDINMNNHFNRQNNFNRQNTLNNRGTRNTWQHNPQHRGGAPYADRATANRFGSNTRGDSLASRQLGAQQQINRQKGNLGSVERGGLDRANLDRGNFDRGSFDRGNVNRGGFERGGGAGRNIGGADSIGSRNLGSGSSIGDRGGFSGGSRGFSGGAARASSNRGNFSMGGRGGGFGGGGRSFGGGGRGGGRR